MGIEVFEREIGGRTFYIRTLPAKKAFKIMPLVAEAAGAGLSALDVEGERDLLNVDVTKVGAGLAALARSLDGDKFDRIVDAFAANTDVAYDDHDGQRRKKPLSKEATQNDVFSADMGTFFRWLSACLEVNFGDFFPLPASAADSDGQSNPDAKGAGDAP